MTIPLPFTDKMAKVLIRTISALSRVHKALLVNIIKRLLDELSKKSFLVEKILQFTLHISSQVFNSKKEAFNDKHFAFKVLKSVGIVLLPDFIDIVV